MKEETFEIETRFLDVPLTEQEKIDVAKTLAYKTQELAETEARKKSVASSFKEKEEAIKVEISAAARLYRDGCEMKEVDCIVFKEFDTGMAYIIRTDTCQIVSERKLKNSERQLSITDAKKKDADLEETNEEIAAKKALHREMTSETSSL